MRTALQVLALALTIAPGPAQALTVSPAALGNAEGNSLERVPFTQTGRFQQVHGDLRASPMLVRALRFRRDGRSAPFPTAVARTLDCEVWMSWGDHATFTDVFDLNHDVAKANVMSRQQVSLPDLTQFNGTPGPWSVRLPFSTPFMHIGSAFDLVWELRVHANSAWDWPYYCDAVWGIGDVAAGMSGNSGGGCRFATGHAMQAHASILANGSTGLLLFTWTLVYGPTSQPAAVLVGQPTAVRPPGVCGYFLVNPMFVIGGTTSQAGVFVAPRLTLPWSPTLVGTELSAQGVVTDPGSAWPVPLFLSTHAWARVPQLPPPGGPSVRYLDAPYLTLPRGNMYSGVNQGLVTAFEN